MDLQTDRLQVDTRTAAPEAPSAPRLRRRRAPWLGGLAVVMLGGYLLSGIFTVAADEQAVVRRFGRVAARLGPGIH